MLSLMLLASIPSSFTTAMSAAPDVQSNAIREAKNGEFIASYYPPGALKRGEQGRVAFRLTIEPDGSLGTCDVTESSGFASLAKETCEIMLRYARLTPVRNEVGRAIRAVRPGAIVWKLPAGATRVARASAKSMPKPDPIICKRSQKTGSLVAKTKQCMPKSEWARAQQGLRDEADRLQARGYFEDGDGCTFNC